MEHPSSESVEWPTVRLTHNRSLCFVGMKELAPPNVNLKKLYEKETQASEPILIIISAGADPSQELEDVAKETVGLEKYHQVGTLMWPSI